MNTTAPTPLTATLAGMRANGIHSVVGFAYDRDYIDCAETRVEVVVYGDGRLYAAGHEVLVEADKNAWLRLAWAATRRTGERPVLVKAQPIGCAEAHALHVTLGKLGVRDHGAFAEFVLGREVPHFRELSQLDAREVRVRALALDTVAA